MLRLPAYQQARILTEQKYPKQAPQTFRTPFYQPALTSIRDYYKSGNDPAVLTSAKSSVRSLTAEARRLNNIRVLEAFEKSTACGWSLLLTPNSKVLAHVHGVDLRLSPDIRADETKKSVVIFVNCRAVRLDPEVATVTIELAHWVLEQAGISMNIRGIRYMDLFTNTDHGLKMRRASTIKAVNQSAKVINALWPAL